MTTPKEQAASELGGALILQAAYYFLTVAASAIFFGPFIENFIDGPAPGAWMTGAVVYSTLVLLQLMTFKKKMIK